LDESNVFKDGGESMKKIIWFVLLTLCFLLIGCEREEEIEKLCKIEIVKEDTSEIIKVMDFMTQGDVADFFDEDEWGMQIEDNMGAEEIHEIETKVEQSELIPEYKIILYQEKTKTLISLDNDEEYEEILEYVTYQDSKLVKEIIRSDEVKNMELPDEFFSYYFEGTEVFFENLRKAVSGE